MGTRHEKFKQLLKFRRAMGQGLSRDRVKYIWGRRFLRELEELGIEERADFSSVKKGSEILDEVRTSKLRVAKENLEKLKVFKWVRFIGVSGSVAAGFAEKDDDIDVFVVVRNGTMWIYRAIIAFRNIFHNKIRAKRHKEVKDKLCVNLICEERGLEFPRDIFNMHELIFLIPLYNKKYKRYILSMNPWMERDFLVKKELFRTRLIPEKKVFFPLRLLNFFAFIAQLTFMSLSGHNPEMKRLVGNYRKGRIEFFEYDYRMDKLENYERE